MQGVKKIRFFPAIIIETDDPNRAGEYIRNYLNALGISGFDVTRISPEDRSIGINETRQITKAAQLVPQHGAYNLIIIDGADRMTEEAQNALLKTLEEPPACTGIIMVTDREDSLLATIRSRALTVRLEKSEKTREIKNSVLPELMAKSFPAVVAFADKSSWKREEAKQFVRDLLVALSSELTLQLDLPENGRQAGVLRLTELVDKAFSALAMLEANVTPNLAVESIFRPDSGTGKTTGQNR